MSDENKNEAPAQETPTAERQEQGNLESVIASTEMMGAPENDEEEAIVFPVYHMKKGMKLPETGMYYVVGSNGIFAHIPNKVGRSLVKVDGISGLEPVRSFIMPKLPKLPARIVNQAYTFFRKVYERHQSESGLVLFYNEAKKDFLLWCPNQEVSHGSCNYDRNDYGGNEPALVGYNIVGSIHSHADFGAFHSGTDIHDEIDFDGLHITIGNVNTDAFSMCASVAIAKEREQVEPEFCAHGLVRERGEESKWLSFQRTHFTLNLTEEDKEIAKEDAQNIEKFWLPKVRKKQWGGWGGMGFYGGGGGKKKSDVDAADLNDEDNWLFS